MAYTQSDSKLRIAICGGGVGGLTLALALSRAQDITVDVYEAARDFAEIGAGIAIRPRTHRFLGDLGLMEETFAINGRPEALRKGESGPVFSYFLSDKPEQELMTNFLGEGVVMVHRAQFHNIIFRHIPEHVGMHTNKRLVRYEDPKDTNLPVRLVFADGSEATCDVLVGADGVKSSVRATMYNDLASASDDAAQAEKLRESISPRFSGAISYRAVVPREKLAHIPPERTIWTIGKLYVGGNMSLGVYPIAQGRLLNVVAIKLDSAREGTVHPQPWVSIATVDEFKLFLDSAAPEPRSILAALEGIELKKWVINVVPTLETWSAGRATLLGDAAHAMTPFQGAGAGQAIEDAQVLSALLTHPRATRATLKHTFDVYESVRKPVTTSLYHASRKNGQITSVPDRTLEECAMEINKAAENIWISGPRPEDDAQRAIELFEAAIGDTVR